ncbi:MAG: serine--tRNA ligase, partial [Elusimicrobia bacterium]|nr:serine--tRNA ligase [Elusimicrobiota bacterium]
MLDLRLIREQPDRVKQALKNRNASFNLDELLEREARLRRIGQDLDQVRHQKRTASEEIGRLKRQGQPVAHLLKQVSDVSVREEQISFERAELEETVKNDLLSIPNLPHESVPAGKPPEANRVLRTWGEPRRFDFKPRTHLDLAELLGIVDFARGAKISGSHFVLFTGVGARLERALIQFMLDLHTRENGYVEVSPPLLVNRAAMTGTGQLPKFEEDLYRFPNDDLFLIPTAEVPVTNIRAGETLEQKELPVCYTAYTPCFRREAGSYGKETRGLLRVHQFDKVELVRLVEPETSYAELEKLLGNAEQVLQKLELPYRVVSLCTGDLGFSSANTYDLEAHSAGTGGWLEVSSCSNFEDFQARRANIRYRQTADKKVRYVHTLNG